LRKEAFEKEDRCLIKSPKVATYDLKPEMSAYSITNSFIKLAKKKNYNFICLNFANCDMVGHTGNFKAIVKAVETVDDCLNKVVKEAQKNNYQIIITADHGNAEQAVNLDGSFNTNHSINPVPCILISENYKKIKNGSLANISPTILKLMGLKKPKEMTSSSLI
jgi:2,3-bisphosphoglycerate-independent phosphoglycerate mutase